MKTSRVSALLLLVALALVCFVSAPVLSGEHPWDADNVGTDGVNPDTLLVTPETDTSSTNAIVPSDQTGGLGDVIGQLAALISSVSLLH